MEERMNVYAMIDKYIAIRDKIAEESRRFESYIEPYKKLMRFIEDQLHDKMVTEQTKSFRTEAGTAYIKSQVGASVEDWPAFLEWVQNQKRWDFLERRVSKEKIKEMIEANDQVDPDKRESLPPGVKVNIMDTVSIRRK